MIVAISVLCSMTTELREGREEDREWTLISYKAFLCSQAVLILLEDLLGYLGDVSRKVRPDLLSQSLWVYDTCMSHIIDCIDLVVCTLRICTCVFPYEHHFKEFRVIS